MEKMLLQSILASLTLRTMLGITDERNFLKYYLKPNKQSINPKISFISDAQHGSKS
jgi:hypothetical protein